MRSPTLTFECWLFGSPLDSITVRAINAREARNLAAYRLRVPRQMVSVRRYPEPHPSIISVTF
jgi:hypothetical protein